MVSARQTTAPTQSPVETQALASAGRHESFSALSDSQVKKKLDIVVGGESGGGGGGPVGMYIP